MDGEKATSKTGKLRPVRPIAGKSFKVKILPKRVHPPLEPSSRPPWSNEIYQCKNKVYEKNISSWIENIPVPCPDYMCFNASRYRVEGGKAVHSGDVVVMKKTYKPAPWCNQVDRRRQVKHCTELVCNKTRDFDIDIPNNYQTVYFDQSTKQRPIALGDDTFGDHLYVPIKKTPDQQCRKVFFENEKSTPSKQISDSEEQAYRRVKDYTTVPY